MTERDGFEFADVISDVIHRRDASMDSHHFQVWYNAQKHGAHHSEPEVRAVGAAGGGARADARRAARVPRRGPRPAAAERAAARGVSGSSVIAQTVTMHVSSYR